MHLALSRRLTFSCLLALALGAVLLPSFLLAQDFDSLFEAYLAGYWKANPGLATRAGVHAHDSLLPDLTAAAVQAEIARQRELLRQFEQLNAAAMPATERADLEVVLNHIRLTLLEQDELRAWKTRPDLLVSALSDSVRDLVVREFAPADRRFEAADSRLKQLPKALRALRANFADPGAPDSVRGASGQKARAERAVSSERAPDSAGAARAPVPSTQSAIRNPQSAIATPSDVSTRTAIALSQAAADFIEKTVPQAGAEQGASRKLQGRLRRDSAAAAAAFRDFARWLQTALLPVSHGPAFQSPEVYARWFRYYLAVDEPPAELLKAAQAGLTETQGQMQRLAESMGHPLGEVLEALSREHPQARELAAAYQAASAQARRFIEQKKLAPLPDRDRLRIERAPDGFPADRLTLDVPGPFEPDLSFYLYAPNLDRLALEAGDRVLAKNNSYAIRLAAVHELFPGHYLQLDLMNRASNLPQKVFANPAFVAGWAQYCEQMALEEGFSDEPRLRLVQLWRLAFSQATAIADIRLHTGAISNDDAVKFLMEQAAMQKDRAEEQVRSIALDPAAAAADYAGLRGILRLREDLRKKLGPAFALSEFHDQLISLGAPPLPAARAILMSRR